MKLKPSHLHHIILILLGIAGMGIILYVTRVDGGGLTLDSVNYIAVARNLLAGHGFISYGNLALVAWPPLYPLLLAAYSFVVQRDPLAVAHVVNAALCGINIYLAGLLLMRHLSSRVLAILGAIAMLLSHVMLDIAVMTLTEPLFVCCVLWFLLSLHTYLTKHGNAALFSMALAAAAACLTRYVGLALVAAGVMCIMIAQRKDWKRAGAQVLLFTLISTLPLALWAIRNYALTATLFGPRAYPLYSVPEEVMSTLRTLVQWYLPVPLETYGIFIIAMLAAVSVFVVRGMLKRRLLAQGQLLSTGGVVLTTATYAVTLIFTAASSTNALISNRYLSPLYVPTLLLLFTLAEYVIALLSQRYPTKLLKGTLFIGVTLWLAVFPLRYLIGDLAQNKPFGDYAYWYQNKAWRDSPMLQYVRSELSSDQTPIYTNGADVFYIHTNRSATAVPVKSATMMQQPDAKPHIAPGAFPAQPTAYLLWFDRIIWRDYLYDLEDIKQIANLEVIRRFDDGALYRLTQR